MDHKYKTLEELGEALQLVVSGPPPLSRSWSGESRDWDPWDEHFINTDNYIFGFSHLILSDEIRFFLVRKSGGSAVVKQRFVNAQYYSGGCYQFLELQLKILLETV